MYDSPKMSNPLPTSPPPPAQNSQPSVEESLRLIDDLKFFLATAPANWQENQIIRRYYLNHDEGFVLCVFWNNLYFVTGTDIVKCLIYRFEQFGRTIVDRKKFEEGIFLDLRNLKCGTDAILEPPKLKFLEFLYKNSCLRTQKKQKVFFWFSVQHDKLFADALERDLKREMADQKTTTRADREPAKSFKYDDLKLLYEQLQEHIDKKKRDLGIETTAGPVPGASHVPVGPSNTIPPANSNNVSGVNSAQNVAPGVNTAPGDYELQYGATDDDFPLDFFPPGDYINETVDPAQAYAANTVPFLDPSLFMNPAGTTGFDDFLIDHALPFIEDQEKDVIKEEYAPLNPMYAPYGAMPYMMDPYMMDPMYYEHVAALQAQQQMMGMMNGGVSQVRRGQARSRVLGGGIKKEK